jgi:hypothetical protein
MCASYYKLHNLVQKFIKLKKYNEKYIKILQINIYRWQIKTNLVEL